MIAVILIDCTDHLQLFQLAHCKSTNLDANQKTGASRGKLQTEVDDMVVKILKNNSLWFSRAIIKIKKSENEFEGEEQHTQQMRKASALEEVCVTQTPPSSSKRRSSSVQQQQQSFTSYAIKLPYMKDCYYAALLHKTKLEIFELEHRCNLPCKYSLENGLCEYYNIQ